MKSVCPSKLLSHLKGVETGSRYKSPGQITFSLQLLRLNIQVTTSLRISPLC